MEVKKNQGIPGAPEGGVINGHEYVDLGLSVLWATCNVGASSPYDPGQYFAWGETEPKDDYTQENYLAGEKVSIGPDDDPAHVLWGDRWRMPTLFNIRELIDRSEWDFHRTEDGFAYFRFTSKQNGNSIVLPFAGHWDEKGRQLECEDGHIWLSDSEHPHEADCLRFDYCHMWESDIIEKSSLFKYMGVPVRPVAKPEYVPKPEDLVKSESALLKTMPKLVRVALDKWGKTPDQLLGYRMVVQRKKFWHGQVSLEDEIRLVDGSEFIQSARGRFEHAFFQLCLPLVHFKFKFTELSSKETQVTTEGIDRERYWMNRLFDVTGGEAEARACRDWLRQWIDVHRNASRILDPDVVARDMRTEGRRVPVKMHICYKDVPDPEHHGWCTVQLARGHQDMWTWYSEGALEQSKPDRLLAGSICGYDDYVPIAAKMRLDETLGIDCEWMKISADWAEGEFERLTTGIRLLTESDVELLRKRLDSQGTAIPPEVLYEGLDNVYVRRRSWRRSAPFPPGHFFEYYLLPGPFSDMDEEWDAYDKALSLSEFSVEEIAKLLGMIPKE